MTSPAAPDFPTRYPTQQISFSDAESASQRKHSCREVFLDEVDQVAPWARLSLMHGWLSDEATILNFRRLLDRNKLAERIFAEVNAVLSEHGLPRGEGTETLLGEMLDCEYRGYLRCIAVETRRFRNLS